MNDPIDKPSTPPTNPPAVHDPTMPLDHLSSVPEPQAPRPRDVAYPPRPIHPTPPNPAGPAPAPPAYPYPTAPPHVPQAPPYPAPQGYGMPPGYPMPIISVTQNNGAGAAPFMIRRGPNHGLHLMLTLITCGLWLPVWIIVAIFDAMNRK
ncbi:hypothetical protein ACFXK0_21515 [Nocardia sp. NPDC059177]|uniref:hypothetical protein n=1 Tax=Nocardia sp. NPDC059177 TaxID=3346759 RepID=UPI0036C04044